MSGLRYDFEIRQGKTFEQVLRWAQDRKGYLSIVSATQAAPCVIEATSHGLTNRWPFIVTGAKGMVELNSADPAKPYLAITDGYDADHLEVMNVNASGFAPYTSSGYVEYYLPQDLSLYDEAEMQIRESITSSNLLATLSTSNGGIVLDNANKRICLQRTAAETAAFDFPDDIGWYDLELRGSSPTEVKGPFHGKITLAREATR